LKQHKVLETHEWRAARKFLLAAALTYLRSPSLDFI
jgi:Zn-dependent membrane protease YugP